jgi:Spy/CpxP family protein refolding chaperone
MNYKSLATSLAAAALVPALALASPMGGGWHHDGMDILHGVSLTDTQKEQLKQIESSSWTQMKSAGEQMRTLHEQLESGLLAGQSLGQLTAIQSKEAALRDQMDQLHLSTEVQIRNLLTPAQLAFASSQHAKLAALHEQEHAVMHSGQTSE